ncbi:hypothetical protein NDA14_007621 [Ustilago hordei]|uniref:Uncharacterized protein n=1 Tax=Ustilago hordei TaxID=120017 RepID=I2G0F8_USTHO|nr:uncharacterized protein UHO2_03550 [Ustilago hordei]KAJ1044252.1 hypothetical protein NDA10_005336 [Ustilago hordei]KAJ1578960.1 hypothetical protein NDA15_002978 [Ustilago hordei]KAJ1595014.1 hypothetical protein NDA14_007621 [Ustilago hordei]CCF52651.1 uncharacterized protein UHOR_04768 [Ustilago hordei]SYW75156.1 uncharacterized protein UHO2_03550 [Ustilago hordei]
MAASDTAPPATTLEPHQLSSYLQPPTEEQQLTYVVQHCNYILPQLASDSLSSSSSLSSNANTPLFTTLPTSSALEAYLSDLTSAHAQASTRTSDLESQLRRQLISSLSGVKILKEKLASLPEHIASTEDKLLDLCEDLVVSSARSAAESSKTGVQTLMNRLEQLHTAIAQLNKAKDYFGILAQAEDLRLEVVKCDEERGKKGGEALVKLSELDGLVRRVEQLSIYQGAERGKEPKLVGFLRAQRSAAFKAIRKARCGRLSQAIAATASSQEKIHPNNPDIDTKTPSSSASKLLESEQVKQTWMEVCQLQDTAEQLGLLKRATAKPRTPSSDGVKAGSEAYQPLLTTQCLIEPMLLRFRYHFDGDRSTNRLDKPEWFLSHIAALIKSQAPLFSPAIHKVPGSGGPVVRLNRAYANSSPSHRTYRHIDTTAELLHGLLTPLRHKLASTLPALLDHPSLLAHTIFQTLTFDADLSSQFPPSLAVLNGAGTHSLASDILDNPTCFNRWLEGEKTFALQRFEQIMESSDAWAIRSTDSVADDETQLFSPSSFPSSEGEGFRTTKSARSVIEMLDSVSERYQPLPSLSQRLSFLAIVQLPILRSYAQRLTRSLDAFESLSSAFARAMPGEIVPGTTPSGAGGDSDMVRGLRGLGRLVKALLSSEYVGGELERWSETVGFIQLSEQLSSTEEGRGLALGLKEDEGREEDRELDAASLGMLLRRGLKRGAAVARPLAGGGGASPIISSTGEGGFGTPKLGDVGNKQVLNEFGRYGVWEEPRRKFGEISQRAIAAIERLVTTETLELLRPYTLRRWDQESLPSTPLNPDSDEGLEEIEPYPTPSLIPALAIFNSHLSHLLTILSRETMLPIYRHISTSISGALVERLVMAGGSKRFNLAGGVRFRKDLEEGWLGVVGELAGGGRLGRKPEAPWKVVGDVARLLTLPSSTSGGAEGESKGAKGEAVTLAKAVEIVFHAEEEGRKGDEYRHLLEKLGNIDDGKVNVSEVLRRRVEICK